MKKALLLSSLFIITTLIFLAGCQTKQPDYPVVDKSQPIIVTDSGVLKELAFMRDEKLISEEDYQIMLRKENIPFFHSEDGTGVESQSYPSCYGPNCDTAYGRVMVQNMMIEKEESNIDINSPIKITDAEILKELAFMRDEKLITSEVYELLIRKSNIPISVHKSLEGQMYPSCLDPDCQGTVYNRKMIQDMMKN